MVSTAWVAANAGKPKVCIVEVDVDTRAYDEGHIPGALGWSWKTELCDTVQRDILPRKQFESLMAKSGISNDTIILYRDNNNWFAAWALWEMKIYGHRDVRLMDGGRKKWLAEGRPAARTGSLLNRPPTGLQTRISLSAAILPEVREILEAESPQLVDVRSRQEFSGELLAPAGLPETCQRGGHIPGARNIPWSLACNEDGTFRPVDELMTLYGGEAIDGTKG